jgi:cation diffusion facilitator CzcD-associated flavoprotein CzcO
MQRIDVAIIGSGFSGLGMAIALARAGRKDFLVFEKAESLGGTWRDNTYPGCACDIPSHLYSFSFAPNPDWSRMYPTQPEIRAYLESCADRFGVRDRLRFEAPFTRAEWDEAEHRWRVTAGADTYSARVLVSGMGGLHKPAYPDIPGKERFSGAAFHSAQWRHDIALEGKRIGVVGTGASAIQFVPQIQPKAAKLDLFQRTPAWILPKGDRPMSSVERDMFRTLPITQNVYRNLIYGLCEVRAPAFLKPGKAAIGEKMALQHLNAAVADPELRRRLTPDYRMGCKRVLIANDFYPAVQQPNVELVTDAILEITPRGILTADGAERALDVLIYGTGFKPMDVLSPAVILGKGGRDLNVTWAAGPEAFYGITVSGFPNLFLLMGPNTGLGHNSMIYMIESQIAHVLSALALMDAKKVSALDVKRERLDGFVSELKNKLATTVWQSGCKSWYVSADGSNHTIWPDFTYKYRAAVKDAKADDYSPA